MVTAEARLHDPESRLQHALDVAYRYLNHRDRTVEEIRRHLASKRVEPVTIDEAVAELERMEYLDDARFARRYAEDRQTLDGWGTDRIERRLRDAGVDAELIAGALADFDAAQQSAVALGLLERRFPVPPDNDRDRERCLSFLVRRGYELDLAYEVVRRFERQA